ncbi:MAG TPA: hypothetical protein VK524_33745, partial [Polyangiaceae bacterium]|nr:hypothetical protein [Polyangiaceae bacterium]
MRLGWTTLGAGLVGLALIAAACGAGNDSDEAGRADEAGRGGSNGAEAGAGGGAGFGNTGGSGGTGDAGGLPPEVETNESFELPHAGEHYV